MARPFVPQLDTPALVLDLDALERNLRRMADHFAAIPCSLRPHVKTHKCSTIARRQVALGAIGVTCAKLGEAEAMATGGVGDILIANQVTASGKLPRLAALASRCDLTVAIDDLANAQAIAQAAAQAGSTVGVLIEVDTGMGRCGLPPDPPQVVALARQLAHTEGLRFRGLMGYEGHTVMIENPAEQRAKTEAAGRLLLDCAGHVRAAGLDVESVSGGGTGTYDITSALDGVTEIQAGSYCLMDARYRRVKSQFENALFLVATVVSRPAADRVILDAGMKAITHEFGLPQAIDPPGIELTHLSEEHGTCVVSGGNACPLKPGDQAWLLPTHCCTTVNLHDRYWCVRDGRLVGTWAIDARGRFD